jgi:hypothetical protein
MIGLIIGQNQAKKTGKGKKKGKENSKVSESESSAPRDRTPTRQTPVWAVPPHPHAPFPLPSFSSSILFYLITTVKLASDNSKGSSLLAPRGISFPADVDTGPQRLSPGMSQKQGRRRRSSSLIYQEPAESIERTSDQAALPNLNANWVNSKGE